MEATGQGVVAIDAYKGFLATAFYGASQLGNYLRNKDTSPDFFTFVIVEKGEGDQEERKEVDLYSFDEVVAAYEGLYEGISFVLVQAHWLLEDGKGEASVTLLTEEF